MHGWELFSRIYSYVIEMHSLAGLVGHWSKSLFGVVPQANLDYIYKEKCSKGNCALLRTSKHKQFLRSCMNVRLITILITPSYAHMGDEKEL